MQPEKLSVFLGADQGLLPIVFINGTGSEIMTRVAAPMIGGLVSSSILTLIVIPVVSYVWKRYEIL